MNSSLAACFGVMLAVTAGAQAAQRTAPAGTPPAIISRLSAEVETFLSLPDTRKRFADEGAEVDFKPPAELRKMIPADIAKWTQVAKAAGMRVE